MASINPVQFNQTNLLSSEKKTTSNEKSFSETFKEMINQADSLQKKSAKAVENFIAGGEENLHEVMAAVEEAQLSFQLIMEIRNKLMESYQELMRMQV